MLSSSCNQIPVKNLSPISKSVRFDGYNQIEGKLVENFQANGYCLIRNFFDAEYVKGVARIAERLKAKNLNSAVKYGYQGHWAWEFARCDGLIDFVDHEKIKKLAGLLLGGKAARLERVVVRGYEAGSMAASMAHWDGSFVAKRPQEILTVWIPLSNIKTGGIAYLPGSNKLDLHRYREDYSRANGVAKDGHPFGSNLDDISDFLGLGYWETDEYHVGDLVLHSADILHASLDNSGQSDRLSIDVRFCPASWRGDDRWNYKWDAADGKKWDKRL